LKTYETVISKTASTQYMTLLLHVLIIISCWIY